MKESFIPEEVFSADPLTPSYLIRLEPHFSEAVEHEADPHLGHAVLEGALAVGQQDAAHAQLLRVHVVVAGADGDHGAEVGPGGLQEVTVHPEEGGAEEDLMTSNGGGDLVSLRGQGQVTAGGQPRQDRGRELQGHEDAGPHG